MPEMPSSHGSRRTFPLLWLALRSVTVRLARRVTARSPERESQVISLFSSVPLPWHPYPSRRVFVAVGRRLRVTPLRIDRRAEARARSAQRTEVPPPAIDLHAEVAEVSVSQTAGSRPPNRQKRCPSSRPRRRIETVTWLCSARASPLSSEPRAPQGHSGRRKQNREIHSGFLWLM